MPLLRSKQGIRTPAKPMLYRPVPEQARSDRVRLQHQEIRRESFSRSESVQPFRLRDFHPSRRFRFVGSVQQLLPNDRPVLLQVVKSIYDRIWRNTLELT